MNSSSVQADQFVCQEDNVCPAPPELPFFYFFVAVFLQQLFRYFSSRKGGKQLKAKQTLKPKWRQHVPSQNIAGDAENTMINLAPDALILPGHTDL